MRPTSCSAIVYERHRTQGEYQAGTNPHAEYYAEPPLTVDEFEEEMDLYHMYVSSQSILAGSTHFRFASFLSFAMVSE